MELPVWSDLDAESLRNAFNCHITFASQNETLAIYERSLATDLSILHAARNV